MWEQQLDSMIDSGHLDPVSVADLGVTYAAETGDNSLIGEHVPFLLPYRRRRWIGSASSSSRFEQKLSSISYGRRAAIRGHGGNLSMSGSRERTASVSFSRGRFILLRQSSSSQSATTHQSWSISQCRDDITNY